jgi:enamine deaminase RidA (YjgF/YER057c/UK114 family)
VTIARYGSGGRWEDVYGYSRVVVAGGRAVTAGCTSTVDGVVTNVGDAYGQTVEAFGIALTALARVGVAPADVVRTRMFVVDGADADAVGRAHGQVFAVVRPAATLVMVARLIHPEHLVEVEVEAVIQQ